MANNLFRALQKAGYEVIENPTSGAEQRNFTLYVRNQATGNNRSLTITRQPGDTNGVIHSTGINQNNQSVFNNPPEGTPLSVSVCLTAPLAISCADAIGSSGDLVLTGNWDVEIDGVVVQTNLSADAVVALFDTSPGFAVSKPLPLPGYQVWVSSKVDDTDPMNGNAVDNNWLVEVNDILIGRVGLAFSNYGNNDNQLFEDLGIMFNTDSDIDWRSSGNEHLIANLRNVSPNRYKIRFKLNPSGYEDFSLALAFFAAYGINVSGLNPEVSARLLAPPSSFITYPDGFEVTLEPYPY